MPKSDFCCSYISVNSSVTVSGMSITTKGVTQCYKVVVRMYLEGNDTTCNNDTYALLTNAYALTLKCELGGTTATAIQSATGSL